MASSKDSFLKWKEKLLRKVSRNLHYLFLIKKGVYGRLKYSLQILEGILLSKKLFIVDIKINRTQAKKI